MTAPRNAHARASISRRADSQGQLELVLRAAKLKTRLLDGEDGCGGTDDGADAGAFCLKVPGLSGLTEDAPASQIVEGLTPEPGEYVIRKKQPSAFFGTDLAAWLIQRQVDTVIVTGCTTSGCVRASVVDSMSYNFRTVVAEDGVLELVAAPVRDAVAEVDAGVVDKGAELGRCGAGEQDEAPHHGCPTNCRGSMLASRPLLALLVCGLGRSF